MNDLLVHPPVIVRNEPPQVIHHDDSEEIRRLQAIIRDLEDEIAHLKAELLRKPMVEYREIRAPPAKVEARTEVIYEKDPFLIEQNARLSKELEDALVGSCEHRIKNKMPSLTWLTRSER